MRLRFLVLLALVPTVGFGQVWEKRVAPGLVYREEIEAGVPRVIHALRFSLGSKDLVLRPALCKGVIFPTDGSSGDETVTSAVRREQATAGVNGDFFPYTGDPLGLLVAGGELVSIPVVPRAAVGMGDGAVEFGVAATTLSVTWEGLAKPLAIDGLNETPGDNRLTLEAPVAGAVASKSTCTAVSLKVDTALPADGSLTATVTSLNPTFQTGVAAEGTMLLVASGTRIDDVKALAVGAKLTLTAKTAGFDWKKSSSALGGGPVLVKAGKVAVDWQAEMFKDVFALNRHPRTAIGRTAEGDVWLVAVEGRIPGSDGCTLEEMANEMLKLGCQDAINLDGGGSTTLNVNGLTLNRPSEKGVERPVADAILLLPTAKPLPAGSTTPSETPEKLSIKVPHEVVLSGTTTATIVDAKGGTIPNAEVLWTARGHAWIDQGGRIRPVSAGAFTVYAWVRGRLLSLVLNVVSAPEAPPAKPKTPAKP